MSEQPSSPLLATTSANPHDVQMEHSHENHSQKNAQNDEFHHKCVGTSAASGEKFTDWITLNVGGIKYCCTRATLTTREPLSMLARMFTEGNAIQWHSLRDSDGAYLIDRSGRYFEPILNYLRHGNLVYDQNMDLKGILEEARFFMIPGLIREIERRLMDVRTENSPLRRCDVVQILASTPHSPNVQLRFQGMNFSHCDLSYLDLRNINFKYANLECANLQRANLSSSDLERANLSNAILDNAQLWDVKLTCANLESASMKCCNFEDPTNHKYAYLEGASLKSADLSGSQMVGVYLRVASLKGAILRNCDLRRANLAGADLENCDLTGSDLQEANLRGANLPNTIFDGMRTPLHMSQTLS